MKVIILFFVVVILCFHLQTAFAYNRSFLSENQTEKSLEMQEDLINQSKEVDESGITTKIYRSTDQSSKLREEKFSTDTNANSDILSKEELVKSRLKGMKITDRIRRKQKPIDEKKHNNLLLPWLGLGLLIVFLGLIFNILKHKKI